MECYFAEANPPPTTKWQKIGGKINIVAMKEEMCYKVLFPLISFGHVLFLKMINLANMRIFFGRNFRVTNPFNFFFLFFMFFLFFFCMILLHF